MNTINCRIKINDFQDIAGNDITPAEVIVLRSIHDVHAGGCCIKNAVAAGKALTSIGKKRVKKIANDLDGNEVEMDVAEDVTRDRTDEEELQRLRQKYQMRAKSGAPGTHICDDIFGGAGAVVKLPATFAELPKKFQIEIKAPAKPEVPEAPANPNAKQTKAELLAKSKAELLAIAAEYKAEASDKQTKEEIADAILSSAGYKE